MTSKTGDNIKRQSEGIGPEPFIRQVETGSSLPYSAGMSSFGQAASGSYINTAFCFKMTWISRDTAK